MSAVDNQVVASEMGARTLVAGEARVVRAVTTIMGVVVGLTFLFGFGNVLTLALRLGVSVWVAPLVAPAVDLSILGLLLGIRHLALAGATAAELQPARRLLVFASLVTLALNIAEPIVAGEYGKAAFDAVGPLLLIGWAEVGPGFIQAMATSSTGTANRQHNGERSTGEEDVRVDRPEGHANNSVPGADVEEDTRKSRGQVDHDGLLVRARQEDARHWEQHRRPISAETLRKRLGVGAARSRTLVSTIRSNQHWSIPPLGRTTPADVDLPVPCDALSRIPARAGPRRT